MQQECKSPDAAASASALKAAGAMACAQLTPPCVGVIKGEGLLCGHHMELMPLKGRKVRIAAAGRHDAGTRAVGCGHCCGIGDGTTLQVGNAAVDLEQLQCSEQASKQQAG